MRSLSSAAKDRPSASELSAQLVRLRSDLSDGELDALYGVREGYVDPAAATAKLASKRPPSTSGEAATIDSASAKTLHAKRA